MVWTIIKYLIFGLNVGLCVVTALIWDRIDCTIYTPIWVEATLLYTLCIQICFKFIHRMDYSQIDKAYIALMTGRIILILSGLANFIYSMMFTPCVQGYSMTFIIVVYCCGKVEGIIDVFSDEQEWIQFQIDTGKLEEYRIEITQTESLTCAICYEDYQDENSLIRVPSCTHVYHKECIENWVRIKIQCPMCRSDFRAYLK